MGNIIILSDEREKRLPHRVHPLRCWTCKHKWIAVYPGTCYGPFECPKGCGMKGHMDIKELVKHDS